MKSLWGQSGRYLRIRHGTIDVSPKVGRMLLAGVGVFVAAIFIAGDAGLWNLWTAQKTLGRIEQEISILEAETLRLRREIDALRNDPFAVERVAREMYGYARPGERIYRIITLNVGDEPVPPRGAPPASPSGAPPTSLDFYGTQP